MRAYRTKVSFLSDRNPDLTYCQMYIRQALESIGLRVSIEDIDVSDEFEDWQAEEIYEANGWLPDTAGEWADMQRDQRGDRP